MVIGLVVACALGACATDPADPADPPTTTPVTTAAPSPTQTPTPTPTPDAATPPERPDMSTVDAETAEAVAVYFLELYPYIFATGDIAEWDALSHPDCIYCAVVGAGVERLAAAGDLTGGGVVDVITVTSSETTPGSWWLVEIEMRQATSSDSAGVIYDTAVIVVRDNERWLIRGVEPRRRE